MMPAYVTKSLVIPDGELEWKFTPSGGPGGQHANRSNTRVELTWELARSQSLTDGQRTRLRSRFGDTVRIVVDDHRSQHRNRDIAVERLAEMCRQALTARRKARKPTKPSRRAKQRRMDSKTRLSDKKKLRRKPKPDS